MKQKIAFVMLSTLILAGCRKKEAVTLPENGVLVEAHCNNGVRDSDEDGVDCGPSCVPCALSIADCGGISPTDNTFQTTSGANLTFSSGTVVASTSTGVLTITGTVGGSYVKATFGTADPQMFTTYAVVTTSPGPNEVMLQYNNGSIYQGYSDVVHLNRLNGKLSIEFCDVYMSLPWGGYTLADGKLTEN